MMWQRRFGPVPVVVFLVLLLIGNTTPPAVGACLEYGPIVQLRGKPVKEVFPGWPHFESVEKGDEPTVYWILHLDQPVCVRGKDEFNRALTGITRVQLVLTTEQYSKFKGMVNKQVVVSGELYAAHTRYHRTDLLIIVHSMQLHK
jgi:hypothetical protein